MQEHIFYQNSDNTICITNARILIKGTTYATPNVTWVSAQKIKTNLLGSSATFVTILLFAALFWILYSFFGASIGWALGIAVILAAGIVGGLESMESFVVKIGTYSGQDVVFKSGNQSMVSEIVQAIEEAIASTVVTSHISSDSAECPNCAEIIKQRATVCRFCGYKIR